MHFGNYIPKMHNNRFGVFKMAFNKVQFNSTFCSMRINAFVNLQ